MRSCRDHRIKPKNAFLNTCLEKLLYRITQLLLAEDLIEVIKHLSGMSFLDDVNQPSTTATEEEASTSRMFHIYILVILNNHLSIIILSVIYLSPYKYLTGFSFKLCCFSITQVNPDLFSPHWKI